MNPELPALQPVDLASNAMVPAYLLASAAVCPFIDPAAKAGCLFATEVTIDSQTSQDIHPRIFEQLVPLVEQFRDARRALPDKQQRLLICHAVVIHVPPSLDADTSQLLAWPNWLSLVLRQLYTPKEIVFGVVRKNVAEKSSLGSAVPVSPFHAIILRSRVVGSDQRFFSGNQPMLAAMMQADDDGLNAHAAVPGVVPNLGDPQAMREAGYFQHVQHWVQKTLPKH